ncbi:precorrin-3B C(17)-methyltransferase [Swingsia samuiensis]|uniref:Precorrin-3B C(17)-methyltransferase n=1 Tax=Swingsia samuiensis TaxID=1293412 RepID=A0A4Y6UJH6_9PROT|nr:precorrin-3B C(17)-methyltransferase [Swingsia samuiensis]QDH17753.1 precorrin-3B C(17)-methyltransferase [Swingsia samuiensis]
MTQIYVIGLGPGNTDQRTFEAQKALEEVTDIVGYGPYVERVDLPEHIRRHGSDNRVEIERAQHALRLAEEGRIVGVVSGGDAGVFGMASALFEAIEYGDPQWRNIEITVIPGITAVLAASARIGAPLGADFCVISLSDNLKPWDVVCRRVEMAAEAGFIIALYNPRSKSRPWQLGEAFGHLRPILPDETPVIFARAIGREDERLTYTDLAHADAEEVDMSTLVLIGNEYTRIIERENGQAWVYTLRKVTH